jgi:hypothetical protein
VNITTTIAQLHNPGQSSLIIPGLRAYTFGFVGSPTLNERGVLL